MASCENPQAVNSESLSNNPFIKFDTTFHISEYSMVDDSSFTVNANSFFVGELVGRSMAAAMRFSISDSVFATNAIQDIVLSFWVDNRFNDSNDSLLANTFDLEIAVESDMELSYDNISVKNYDAQLTSQDTLIEVSLNNLDFTTFFAEDTISADTTLVLSLNSNTMGSLFEIYGRNNLLFQPKLTFSYTSLDTDTTATFSFLSDSLIHLTNESNDSLLVDEYFYLESFVGQKIQFSININMDSLTSQQLATLKHSDFELEIDSTESRFFYDLNANIGWKQTLLLTEEKYLSAQLVELDKPANTYSNYTITNLIEPYYPTKDSLITLTLKYRYINSVPGRIAFKKSGILSNIFTSYSIVEVK